MPISRDFLMRMIEKLAAAFFRIAAGKSVDAPEQALMDIEDLLAEALGTSREFALGLGPAAIDTVEPPLAAELSRLLLLHAELSDRLGQPDRAARARRMGFRALERALDRPGTEFARIAAGQLREHLESLGGTIPAEHVARACLGAHRNSIADQEWSDAEDWLFFALELAPAQGTVDAGRAFYRRLSELTDEELGEGGLSREEIAESSAELDGY